MGSTTNTTIDFSSILNASVEEQTKIQEAVKEAKKAYKDALDYNNAREIAANVLVSKIQSDLKNQKVDATGKAKEAYAAKMINLGMSAQVFPYETAALAVDKKVLTPILETAGKIGKAGFNLFNGVKARVLQGFNK